MSVRMFDELGNGKLKIAQPDDWYTGRYTDVVGRSLEKDATLFILPEPAREAVEAALALGEPLLLTGDPGTGKTQLAYWLAVQLGWERPVRYQVQSGATARDFRYEFDELGRFHEGKGVAKERFLRPGALWQAMHLAQERRRPAVLLVDEIDKATRDFPNDLLRDIEDVCFTVPELDGREIKLEDANLRPVVVITSNGERNLPAPFLRRCICCHLVFDRNTLLQAVAARAAELGPPTSEFIRLAIQRFERIRAVVPEPKPATAEFLMWTRLLRKLQLEALVDTGPLAKTAGASALVKTREGREALEKAG